MKNTDAFKDKLNRHAARIQQILSDCKDIQNSNESTYTKKCAIISAYNNITDLLDYKQD